MKTSSIALNVLRLELPALRERREDIPLLIKHIMKQRSTMLGAPAKGISEGAMEVLLNYSYPGNVRELEKYSGACPDHMPG